MGEGGGGEGREPPCGGRGSMGTDEAKCEGRGRREGSRGRRGEEGKEDV